MDSPEDFSASKDWTNTYTVTRGGVQQNVQLKIPVACCKFQKTEDTVTVADKYCAENPNDANSNWKTVIHDQCRYFMYLYTRE